MKLNLISLGCSKNQIDSEQMLHILEQNGFTLTPDAGEADVAVVNTCGFIDAAKSEAIENILELGILKADPSCPLRTIVVAGCLVETQRDELMKELPEIDGVVNPARLGDIADIVRKACEGGRPAVYGDKNAPIPERDRLVISPHYTAYVRLAEGCDNRCAYCVIPDIRGRLRSRRREDILDECAALARQGVQELIIIAQDITQYGVDIYGRRALAELINDIAAIPGPHWIRLNYLHPAGIDDALIDVIASHDNIVKYLDIPIQHISDRILAVANRRYDGALVRSLFSTLRRRLPGFVLRTTVITGLPGETEEEFAELCGFLREFRPERCGVFAYSPQEGTPMAGLPDQIDEDIRDARAAQVQAMQHDAADAFARSQIKTTVDVLVEGYDSLMKLWYGRGYADLPDVDHKIFFKAPKGAAVSAGSFVAVAVDRAIDGDLMGKLVI